MQTASPGGNSCNGSLLLLSTHKDKDRALQHSPACGLSLELHVDDLARERAHKDVPHPVHPHPVQLLQQQLHQMGDSPSSSGRGRGSGSGEKESLYDRILQDAAFSLPRTPNGPRNVERHTPPPLSPAAPSPLSSQPIAHLTALSICSPSAIPENITPTMPARASSHTDSHVVGGGGSSVVMWSSATESDRLVYC